MIKWMYYPKNKKIDDVSSKIVDAFKEIADSIDSSTHDNQDSNTVLANVRSGLEEIGFCVEKSKRVADKIELPVLFGENGRIEKKFEVDAYLDSEKYIVEVEAGRAVTNFQFLKDFFEACIVSDAKYLCIAVRNNYKGNDDFSKVCLFFDSLYLSGRLGVPLDGILIIGY